MTAAGEPLLRVEGVSKKFCRSLRRSLRYGLMDLGAELSGLGGRSRPLREDEFWAVNDVSFELRPGDCLGLIGHNGAGKTTLLRLLTGLIKPDRGRIESRGKVAALIALGAGFNPVLSGRENIYVNGALLGMGKREIQSKLDWIIDFSGLADFIDAPVQTYSSGMTVRLGFAIAAAIEPDILILDEVLAVGDMEFRAKCQGRLNEIKHAGGALILVSHSMEQVVHHCNRAILLHGGTVASDGDPQEVIAAYLTKAGHNQFAELKEPLNDGRSRIESSPHYNPSEKRWGDGRASILDIDLMQSGHSWPKTVIPGIAVVFKVTVRFAACIEDPIFGLTIKDSQGAEIFHTNSRTLGMGSVGPLQSGETVDVEFEIEPFLKEDDYMLSIGVASEERGGIIPLDRRYDCARIRIAKPVMPDGEPDLKPRMRLTITN